MNKSEKLKEFEDKIVCGEIFDSQNDEISNEILGFISDLIGQVEQEKKQAIEEAYKKAAKFLDEEFPDCITCPIERDCNYSDSGCIFEIHKD